ncbi:STAS domain-containing protein [Streptomyces sp. NBC_01264]|uniref:STAS domain-containing protein n=1 Tax=Streptomyces sp. NBC_01264 TaxID=2903804 RepID=UPI002257F970|nr:STAS domain-containing protein [Streptomyces sp. NBC_01264]MCX4775574.1 STAS domain-containing protein [Streptomyces sp. NBC_01264]
MDDLRLSHEHLPGDVTHVIAEGELDVFTHPLFREFSTELIILGHVWQLVDLTGVDFMDTSGVAVLHGAHKRASAHGGAVAVVCHEDGPGKPLRVIRLSRWGPTHETVERALEVLARARSEFEAG